MNWVIGLFILNLKKSVVAFIIAIFQFWDSRSQVMVLLLIIYIIQGNFQVTLANLLSRHIRAARINQQTHLNLRPLTF